MDRAPSIDLPKDGHKHALSLIQPKTQSFNGAGLRGAPEGDADLGPGALLIRLGAGDEEGEALGRPGDMLDIEPDKLGPANGTGKTYEEQRLVPDAGHVVAADREELLDVGRRESGRTARRLAMGPADASQGLPASGVAGIQRLLAMRRARAIAATRRHSVDRRWPGWRRRSRAWMASGRYGAPHTTP